MSNFSDQAKHILATVAPTILTGFLGPFGGLAATALSAVLGTTPGDTKAMDTAIVSADPEMLLKLKTAENDFAVKIEELGIQREQLAYADTASARGREIAVKDNTPRIVAYIVILLVIAAEGGMLILGQPTGIDGVVLGRILGTLDAALMLVLGYYYGSSKGSTDKSDTIAALAGSSAQAVTAAAEKSK